MSGLERILADAASSPKRVRVKAFAFVEREPPNEIQLWNAGDNPTDYGVHRWTARSESEVLARYETRGNPLLVDVEHNGAKDLDDEPTLTGGYARLELRAGTPWLVFDWSAYGVDQIKTGQRRFLSPEYDVDRATGEIIALYRVSLVADPGTHRARMLAAANTQETRMDPKLAAIMAILSSVSDPQAAIDAIKSLVANLDGGDPPSEPAPDPVGDDVTAAAGGDAGGDGYGDDKGKDKVAAGAPAPSSPKPAAPAPSATTTVTAAAGTPATPPVDTTRVTAAATAAVLQIENAQRDHLMATQGDRLDPSIRRWASAQSLAIVTGLLAATPDTQEPATRTQATRGSTQGVNVGEGLQGRDLEELQKRMGTFKASSEQKPHITANGRRLILPTVLPSVTRALARAATPAPTAPGKAGK